MITLINYFKGKTEKEKAKDKGKAAAKSKMKDKIPKALKAGKAAGPKKKVL